VKVFISHASEDIAAARSIAHDLSVAGHDVWLDYKDLSPVDALWDTIARQIMECDVFIVCISRISLQAYWVRREVLEAYTAGKPLALVKVGDFESVGGNDVAHQMGKPWIEWFQGKFIYDVNDPRRRSELVAKLGKAGSLEFLSEPLTDSKWLDLIRQYSLSPSIIPVLKKNLIRVPDHVRSSSDLELALRTFCSPTQPRDAETRGRRLTEFLTRHPSSRSEVYAAWYQFASTSEAPAELRSNPHGTAMACCVLDFRRFYKSYQSLRRNGRDTGSACILSLLELLNAPLDIAG
jgi:hypothetical protein